MSALIDIVKGRTHHNPEPILTKFKCKLVQSSVSQNGWRMDIREVTNICLR